MSEPQRAPAFIPTGEVTRRLGGISRSMLQHMFDHLPYLYVTRVETRLFPAAYINAFAAYLRRTGQKATVPTAASFWRTDEAQRLYAVAVAQFHAGLSRQTLTGRELSMLLGISYHTIMGWHMKGAIQALLWKTPATRREYTPPTRPSMFLSASDINTMVRGLGRSITTTAQLGQLRTPRGGRVIPAVYMEALLNGTSGPINDRLVWTFNATRPARSVMTMARQEFADRVAERLEASPFNGLLVIDDVTWLLGVTKRMVHTWCAEGQLPFVEGPDGRLVKPEDLRARCRWVLPTAQK